MFSPSTTWAAHVRRVAGARGALAMRCTPQRGAQHGRVETRVWGGGGGGSKGDLSFWGGEGGTAARTAARTVPPGILGGGTAARTIGGHAKVKDLSNIARTAAGRPLPAFISRPRSSAAAIDDTMKLPPTMAMALVAAASLLLHPWAAHGAVSRSPPGTITAILQAQSGLMAVGCRVGCRRDPQNRVLIVRVRARSRPSAALCRH